MTNAVASYAKKAMTVVTSTVTKVTTGIKEVTSSVTLNDVQMGLDVAGLIPFLGEIADGLNGTIYAARGDKLNAALSFSAMIPVVGSAATAVKHVDKVVKLTENIADSGKTTKAVRDNVITKGIDNVKYKKISETPSEDVNKWWKEEMGYSEPPYKTGTLTQEIQLTEKSIFVRVYDGENSGMYGGWFMKADDIKGLSPSQIQEKFALPTTPKFVANVELDAGTIIRTGTVNPLFGFEGGGQQFDLMGQRVGNFTNPRPLP